MEQHSTLPEHVEDELEQLTNMLREPSVFFYATGVAGMLHTLNKITEKQGGASLQDLEAFKRIQVNQLVNAIQTACETESAEDRRTADAALGRSIRQQAMDCVKHLKEAHIADPELTMVMFPGCNLANSIGAGSGD